MKIIPNIVPVTKLLLLVSHINHYIPKIAKAQEDGDFEKEREYILDCTSYFGPESFRKLGCDFVIHGQENIPDEGPVVVIANHQGYADIVAILGTFTKFQIGFVAKKELTSMPVFGKWIPRIRSVFMDRDDSKASLRAINKGVEYIKDGFSLCIFPEGTRSKGPETAPFMRGAFKLAIKPGVPIVPVSINGTYKMFEETGAVRPARIDVIVHEPIPTADLPRSEEKALCARVEQMIADGVTELQKYQ